MATFDAKTQKWLADEVLRIAASWYSPPSAEILEISPGYKPRPLRYKDVIRMLTGDHMSIFAPFEWSIARPYEREEWLVATVESLVASGAMTHPIYKRRPPRKARKIDPELRQWIAQAALEMVTSEYQYYWEQVIAGQNSKYPFRPNEPRMTVGMVTSYLRMLGGRPDRFEYSAKSMQTKWVKSVLDQFVRRGVMGKSMCTSPLTKRHAYCYDIPRE